MKDKNYKKTNTDPGKVEEAQSAYGMPKHLKLTKDFTYNEFKKITSKTDFTQKEWSDILQRYSKDNSTFSFSVTDRILQIDKVLERGLEVFGSYEKFLRWLRDDPYMLEGRLSLLSLASFEGINNVLTQLGRIEHGILA
jgi:hypothetical protein